MIVPAHSRTFLPEILGLLVSVMALPFLFLGLFLTYPKWFPILITPFLMSWIFLAIGLCIWTWYRLGRWLRAHGTWAMAMPLVWTTLGIWSCWKGPAEPLLNRYAPALPLLALGAGLWDTGESARNVIFEASETRPFRWGLVIGLVYLGFSSGISSITSDVVLKAMSAPFHWIVLTLLSMFVSLLLADFCGRIWPSVSIAFMQLAFLGVSRIFPQSWKAYVSFKPISFLPQFVGLLLGASLAYTLTRRGQALIEGESDRS